MLKRFVKRLLSCLLLAALFVLVVIGGTLGVQGWRLYRATAAQKPIAGLYDEISSRPGFASCDQLPQTYINAVISALFFICYTYQFLYIPLVLLKKRRPLPHPAASHRYAVLIAARNEENVIAGLLDSLAAQTYDMSLVTVFVAADNCTDSTAAIAREHGAVVYERFNHVNVGKGYALDFLLQHIGADYPEGFDGYFVFDADNILSPDYLERMNESFSAGNEIVTSYRNSKNFGDNWISAGYALWFLRESRYLDHARSLLGTSCAVSRTGFAPRTFTTARTVIRPAVEHPDATVGPQFVARLHSGQPPFERMVVAGDLIPGAHVARQVERRHRSAVGTVGGTAVYHADDKQRSGQ